MKLVVANWKMNPDTAKEAQELFISVGNAIEPYMARPGLPKSKYGRGRASDVEVVVCLPFVWLCSMAKREAHSAKRTLIGVKRFALSAKPALGAQDVFWENPPAGGGAYTGEISPVMLRDLGCSHVIIGHSERRIHLGETDEMVNKKILAARKARFVPILCIGEHTREGNWSEIIAQQLERALYGVPASKIQELIIAYEPVWAIGTGVADTPEDALSASIFIRKVAAKLFGRAKTKNLRVLYGGSVTAKNVQPFVAQEGIDGVLVGHASLDPAEFSKIVQIVASSSEKTRI